MAYLEKQGYACTRSAASLGVWDVVGVGKYDVVLVQVKSGRWPGKEEMQTLRDFPVPPNVRRIIHRWRDGENQPDVLEIF